VAVFPSDERYSALWLAKTGKRALLQFSLAGALAQPADVTCRQAQWLGGAWQVSALTPAGELRYALHIAGLHNVRNSLAALACTLADGVSLDAIALGLSAFQPVKGRSHAISLQQGERGFTLVDDSYNANPDSVRAAIEVLAALPGPHLLVLGDMGEVGDQGPQFHAEAGQLARSLGIETLFTLGDLSNFASKSFAGGRHFEDLPALQAAVLAELPQFGSVLVKGSRFMKMERLVAAIVAHSQAAEGARHVA